MKIVFVIGGSYKGFYLNNINRLKNIDLLIFHQGIFYELDYSKENIAGGIISKELISLNQKFKCPILVYGKLNKNGIKTNCYILCTYGKVSVIDCIRDVYLYIKGKFILIGNRFYNVSKAFATISLVKDSDEYRNFGKIYTKNYFLCHKKGVILLKRGKIYRKFRKCCYFTLKK